MRAKVDKTYPHQVKPRRLRFWGFLDEHSWPPVTAHEIEGHTRLTPPPATRSEPTQQLSIQIQQQTKKFSSVLTAAGVLAAAQVLHHKPFVSVIRNGLAVVTQPHQDLPCNDGPALPVLVDKAKNRLVVHHSRPSEEHIPEPVNNGGVGAAKCHLSRFHRPHVAMSLREQPNNRGEGRHPHRGKKYLVLSSSVVSFAVTPQ